LKRIIIILLFLIFSYVSFAQDIRIGLFHQHALKTVLISTVFGQYQLWGDSQLVKTINPNEIIYLNQIGDKIQIKEDTKDLGSYQKIELLGKGSFNTIRLKADNPQLKPREYQDDFYLEVIAGKIRIINQLDLEHYVAAVVESEGGSKAGKEYYKTQAILCRTYALENYHKHEADGFNLCDDVHCQAFKGRAKFSDLIVEATSMTKGLVIVDSSLSLITASFYSNSGGYTAASEHVWQQSRSYLRSVEDPYSIGGNSYLWTKSVPLSSWVSYLKQNGFKISPNINGSDFNDSSLRRKKYYVFGSDSIAYTALRNQFKLKSTLFTISYADGQIVLNGRGYGHGVGLSQEGAMQMDKKGFSYKDIIKFYYQNVYIVSLKALQY